MRGGLPTIYTPVLQYPAIIVIQCTGIGTCTRTWMYLWTPARDFLSASKEEEDNIFFLILALKWKKKSYFRHKLKYYFFYNPCSISIILKLFNWIRLLDRQLLPFNNKEKTLSFILTCLLQKSHEWIRSAKSISTIKLSLI